HEKCETKVFPSTAQEKKKDDDCNCENSRLFCENRSYRAYGGRGKCRSSGLVTTDEIERQHSEQRREAIRPHCEVPVRCSADDERDGNERDGARCIESSTDESCASECKQCCDRQRH